MRRLLIPAAAVGLFALSAHAQQDAPIPYPDEDQSELPRSSRRTSPRNEVPVEKQDREHLLGARFDDPNIGIGAELVAGAMFLEGSRGQGVDPSFAFGVRATWEWGRLLSDDFWHEAMLVDFNWAYASLGGGTTEVHGSSNFHYFTVTPAFLLPFGTKSSFGAFAQGGVGFGYQVGSVTVGTAQTVVSGVKPLFQYGIGLRGRPAINSEGTMRICFRVELTRFRRGYMDDTLIAGGVGMDF